MSAFPTPLDGLEDTLQAFLRAVKDDPDADAPRLVLADWLDEQGDGPRAELIRLQCGPRPCRHRQRIDELLAIHRPNWLGALPAEVNVEFRRGLMHVQITAERLLWDDFPSSLQRAWAVGWVTSLCLTEVGHLLSLVAQSDWLTSLTDLDLSYGHLDDDMARVLSVSPRLSGLTHLDLGYNPLSEAGERCLVESPNLSRLKTLRLDSPLLRVAQELRNRLLTCRNGHLSLSGVSLLHEGHVELVANAPQMETLTSLDLSSTHLTDASLGRLLGRKLVRLSRLTLRGNLLTDTSADILALARTRLPVLADLDLSSNRITEAGMRTLAQASWPARLRSLDLTGNPIAVDGPARNDRHDVSRHEATLVEVDNPGEKPLEEFPERFL